MGPVVVSQECHRVLKEPQELFAASFGIHHAGIVRSDRNLVEKFFSQGLLKVLGCRSPLA